MSISFTAIAVATTLVAAGPNQRQLVDRVVAVVNDDVITLSDVEKAAKPFAEQADTDEKRKALNRDILDQLIAEQLISQQVNEAKIDVTEDEVERAIKDILKQNNINEDDLKQAVE